MAVLRYEELLADPLPGARRLAEALELPGDDQTLRAAVEASSFQRMQSLDRKRTAEADPGLKGRDLNILFVRKGSSDEWRKHFDRELLSRLTDAFGGVMERLGYQ